MATQYWAELWKASGFSTLALITIGHIPPTWIDSAIFHVVYADEAQVHCPRSRARPVGSEKGWFVMVVTGMEPLYFSHSISGANNRYDLSISLRKASHIQSLSHLNSSHSAPE